MAILQTMARNVATLGQALGLPEMGISERISGQKATTAPYSFGSSAQAPSGNVLGQQMYSSVPYQNYSAAPYSPAPTQKVNYPSSGSSQQTFQNPFDQIQFPSPTDQLGGGESQMDIINSQFNQFNALLDQQEALSQSRFEETKGLYTGMKESAEKQYGEEKTTQTEELKKSESLNLAKVRQLLGELSQRNAARTAITGGGSISEVLAERFGREAQSRLGNVMEQTQSAIRRVNTFYDNAITKLNESYQAQILQAKQTLDDNLFQIRQAKVGAASAKQQATLQAWQDFYNNVNQAKVQAASFKAQYDLWKQQQDATLAQTGGFNLENAGQFNEGIQSSYSPLPQAGVPVYDPVQRTWFTKKQGETEDELAERLGLNYSTAFQAYTPGMAQ